MKITPNYTVIYNDDDIIVLNKRSGLLVAQDRYDPDAPRLDSEAEKEFAGFTLSTESTKTLPAV